MSLTDSFKNALPLRPHEVRSYARALFASPSDPGVRLLIFAQGRSGTTLLESLVCSTGLFVPNGEPLSNQGRRVLSPTAYVRGLARDPTRQGPGANYVCHVKPDHLDWHREKVGARPRSVRQFVEAIAEDGWNIVRVTREDGIRQVVSALVAEARGGWHKKSDGPEPKVYVDRGTLERRIRYKVHLDQVETDALDGIEHIHLTYERDLLPSGQHELTVDRVMNHVGLEKVGPVSTDLRKINARPLRDTVENYHEFETWVRDLGWASSLDGFGSA